MEMELPGKAGAAMQTMGPPVPTVPSPKMLTVIGESVITVVVGIDRLLTTASGGASMFRAAPRLFC